MHLTTGNSKNLTVTFSFTDDMCQFVLSRFFNIEDEDLLENITELHNEGTAVLFSYTDSPTNATIKNKTLTSKVFNESDITVSYSPIYDPYLIHVDGIIQKESVDESATDLFTLRMNIKAVDCFNIFIKMLQVFDEFSNMNRMTSTDIYINYSLTNNEIVFTEPVSTCLEDFNRIKMINPSTGDVIFRIDIDFNEAYDVYVSDIMVYSGLTISKVIDVYHVVINYYQDDANAPCVSIFNSVTKTPVTMSDLGVSNILNKTIREIKLMKPISSLLITRIIDILYPIIVTDILDRDVIHTILEGIEISCYRDRVNNNCPYISFRTTINGYTYGYGVYYDTVASPKELKLDELLITLISM